MAQLGDIKDMYDRGEAQGASHMIVAYDSFDGGDYPIYVMPGTDPKTKVPTNGDRVMECYRYSLGWESQAREYRAQHWEFDAPEVPTTKLDARVPKVAQALYEQERVASNVAQFWPDWNEAPNSVHMAYEKRAIDILALVDSF